MPRNKGSTKWPPAYTRHATGQARVRIAGKDHYLGKYGSKESHEEYARLIAQASEQGTASLNTTPATITIAEMSVSFLEYAATRYGRRSGVFGNFRRTLMYLCAAVGGVKVSEFGPRRLIVVREQMIGTKYSQHGERLVGERRSRKSVNEYLALIKQVFRWAAQNEIIDGSQYHALLSVPNLRPGETQAVEMKRRVPARDEDVDATLPFLSPSLSTMVQIIRLTGMRVGEAVLMRPMDIDRSKTVWIFTPTKHKTERYGIQRAIRIGPRAQALIQPYLDRPTDAFLWSPLESMAARRLSGGRAKNRGQPFPDNRPGVADTNVVYMPRGPRHSGRYGIGFNRRSIANAIANACRYAEAWHHKEHPDIPADQTIVRPWFCHLLRHQFATNEADRSGSLKTAQIALGHTSQRMTQRYVVDRHDELDAVFENNY